MARPRPFRGSPSSLPKRSQDARSRALHALRLLRSGEAESAAEARRRAGVSTHAFNRYARAGTRKVRGRIQAANTDRIFREVTIVERGQGERRITVGSSREASKAARYRMDVLDYVHGDADAEVVRSWWDESIGGVPVEADPDVIDALAGAGQLDDLDSDEHWS
jgi:hypothetical protein